MRTKPLTSAATIYLIYNILCLLNNMLAAQQNLVVNPNFSNGTTGWSTTCTIELNPETVYGGHDASNIVCEIDKERCIYQEIDVLPGTMYTFSYKAGRRLQGAPPTVGFTMRISGVQSGNELIKVDRTYTNTVWNLATETYSFVIPVNTTDTRVKIQFDNYYTNGTHGTLIDDISMTYDSLASVLPLKIIFFDAQLQHRNALLTWTAENKDNEGAYFLIERASKQNHFDSIGKVAVNNQLKSYSYSDIELPSGKTYYRLKAINSNGSISYSKIIMVENKSTSAFTVYPNPATTSIGYSLNSTTESIANVSIYNISGALLLNKQVKLKQGINAVTLDITSLQTGSFFLKVSNNEGENYIKAFKKGL